MSATRIGSLLMASLAVAACGATNTTTTTTPSQISGTATVAGSTALQPLITAAKEGFEVANSNATVSVTGGGSFQGLSEVASGAVDIGDSDVPASAAPDPSIGSKLVDHQVAVVAFAIIVHPGVTVTNLTKRQVQDIISGKITDWKSVGQATSLSIKVFLRPKTSGTRYTFKKVVLDTVEETTTPAAIVDSTTTVVQNVSQTAGGISYVSLGAVKPDSGVKKVNYEGVEASVANVISGAYQIFSHEHMYTCTCDKGPGLAVANALIEYILSPVFQNSAAFTKLVFIPVGKVTARSPADG